MRSNHARAKGVAAILIVSFAIAAGCALLPHQAFGQAGPRIERELAGLRLWQPYDTIFKKYGVPKYIEIGRAATQVTFTSQPTILDLRTGRATGGVGTGGMAGPTMPYGPTGPTGVGPGGQYGEETVVYMENEITYYYRKDDVVILVTIAADRKIAEIGVYARTSEAQRRGGYKTSRGIGMNSDYVQICEKYGFPNEHRSMGAGTGLTLITYTETNNVSFLLDENYRVVALVIGTNDIFQKAVSESLR